VYFVWPRVSDVSPTSSTKQLESNAREEMYLLPEKEVQKIPCNGKNDAHGGGGDVGGNDPLLRRSLQ